jgi:TolB-like protein
MDEKLRRGFTVGAFKVEPLTGHIAGPTGDHHVQPKVMDVLVHLAEHAGELVERNALLEQIWRRVTSEEVLTRCISELRRVFGDERGTPSYIQTVPKRGYRLLEPAVTASAPAGSGGPRTAASAPPETAAAMAGGPPATTSAVASVAVLPFDNHSPDPQHQFMGDAFAAELHSTLARTDRLRVAARRSSFVFKDQNVDVREIGRQLGVGFVISGSVRCAGGQVRISAELNDAGTGSQVWAQSYDRKTEDLLAVETEVAGAIVAAFTTQQLRAELHDARRRATDNLDAWGLVQKARSYVLDYTADGLAEAIAPLERAIALDPDYPQAHATLSSLLVERLVNGLSDDPKRDEATALDSASKALTLAPQDPFILKLVSLALTYCGDYRKALACLRQAVTYAPFDFGAWGYFGWPLTASGRVEDLTELRGILTRLLTMEPHHPGVAFWRYHHSVADVCEGRYDAGLEHAQAAVELHPRLALALMHYANVLGQLNLKERADEALARCREVNAALTPKHFESFVKRTSNDKAMTEHRTGGLRKLGLLRR